MKKFIAVTYLIAPSVLLADTGLVRTTTIITTLMGLVRNLTILAAGVALVVFFFGLVKFIMKAGDSKEVENGRRLMIWGTVALFVMVSIWGLVRLMQNELGGLDNTSIGIPGFNG